MSKKKVVSSGCPFQEAKQAIVQAEADFSIMLEKGLIDCTKAMDKLKKKHEKLSLSYKKSNERKKLLMEKIKNKPTEASKKQLEKVRDTIAATSTSIKILSEEKEGVKHGLTKIKALQKQRLMEEKVLIKFRKDQEKKAKMKMAKKKK